MKTAQVKGKKGTGKSAPDKTSKELAEIFKSLADGKRVQILRLLMREGGCVSRICEELGKESQPAVSHHLTQRSARPPGRFRAGRKFNHYFISSDAVQRFLAQLFPTSNRTQQTFTFGDLEVTFKTK